MSNLQKKIIAISIFGLFGLRTSAQVSKGSIIIPAQFSFNNKTIKGTSDFFGNPSGEGKYSDLNFKSNIGVGYSVFSRFVIGFTLSHDLNRKIFYDSNGGKNFQNYPITLPGVFGKYYLINKKNSVFIETSYLSGKPKTVLGWSSDRISETMAKRLSVGVGYSYFLSSKLSFDGIASFSRNNYSVTLKDIFAGDPTRYKSQRINENEIKLNIGLSYYFNKK